jgi:hypothetical protein
MTEVRLTQLFDVLLDVVDGYATGTLLLATLRTSIQDVVAELIARPFAP